MIDWLMCAWLLVPGAAAAQHVTAVIGGIVTGDAGDGLQGATITVQNQSTGLKRSATTGPDGRYVIVNLPVEGQYSVRAELAGFGTALREGVTLIPNESVLIDFALKLAGAETVVVSASAPSLDTGQSGVQQLINERLLRSLPLAGRNFVELASLAAGFTGNPNFPNPQGQSYWTNNLLVDGASHFSKWRSGPRAFNAGVGLESIKELQVLTNRFSAEFGEALASITTAVTKAGTNQLHGTGLLFVQESALNSTPVFAARKPPAGAQQYGFTLGGPLVMDRTHFWSTYEGRRSRGHNFVVSPASAGAVVPDNQDEHLAFFRVDHQLSERHLMMGHYNAQRFRWHNEPGGLVLPGSGTTYANDVQTALFTDALQLSPQLLNELRGQFARYTDRRQDLQPSVFVSRNGYSLEGGTLGARGFGANPEDTWEAADTLVSWRGPHTIKVGGGFKYVRAHNDFLSYGRGAYFFGGAPDVFRQPFLFVQGLAPTQEAAVADPRSLSAFGFIQHDWRIRPRITLNLGLRYDIERVSNVRNFSVPADKNNFQPRVGAAWDLSRTGRTVVRGGAGLYTQQHLLFYINRVQLEGLGGTALLSLTPGMPQFPTFPTVLSVAGLGGVLPARDIHRVDSTFTNPYSVQATVGFERALPADVVLTADYVYLNGRALMSLVDANAPASIQKPAMRSVASADLTRSITPLPGTYRELITLGNLGESWYHALQLKAQTTRGRLQSMASYTLSHAEDMANYQLPEDSRNLAAEKARASTDVRHNLVVAFTWDVPGQGPLGKDWSVSGIGTFRSSRPYDITWGDDRNGTTQNDARPDGRSTGGTDAYANVDLALARRFTVRTRRVEARLEAFNVFDTTNFNEYVGVLLSPLYGKPVSAFPKRRIQVAGIVRF